MSSDQKTLAVYDAKAHEYAALMDSYGEDPLLIAFIDALPNDAYVLDLGCGPGWAARAMAAAGLRVDATDASAEMVALARQIDGIDARQATFEDISGTDLYDGIWANFSLLHAPRDAMPGHLAALHRALKPGGLFHIGVKTGSGSHRDSLGRVYTFYTEDELRLLLVKAGFVPFATRTGVDKGLSGSMDPWFAISARG